MSEQLQKKNEVLPQKQFQARLQAILYTPVTVENISTFADAALADLIALNEAVTSQYQHDFEESVAYTGAELEDAAYTAYELENLNTILDRITEVKDMIEDIKVTVTEALSKTSTVITPPDQRGPVFSETGSGTYEAPSKVDRLLTLAYILSRDFDIEQDRVEYSQGSTTDAMLRQEPYVRVLIEDINRIVYVCDEEGNASYVFDSVVLEHLGITPPELDVMTKNQRNALIRVSPTVGRRIIQSPEWRSVMSTALREDFSNEKTSEQEIVEPQSEFRERVKFLPFGEFETAVREAYEAAEAPGNVRDWYQEERKNHKEWPANPDRTYKGNGWKSWPELVGREVIEFLPFGEFETAVREAYEAAEAPVNLRDWYQEERKNHKEWPASPDRTYKGNGWKSWPELVGREVIEFLPFGEFETEVREAYEAAEAPGNVRDWYQEEHKNHKGWPAGPGKYYKGNGWKSWPELVGREVIEFLPFGEFETEVREAYEAAEAPGNVRDWYQEEHKNHKGWPAHPDRTYKDTGWKNFAELTKKEKLIFLEFKDFTVKVQAAYKEAGSPGGVRDWYLNSYRQHPGWPAAPYEIYRDKGWEGFPLLVNKEQREWPDFSEFVKEVRAAYKEAGSPGGVRDWYKMESKKHTKWPTHPDETYEGQGWKGYPDLVNKEQREWPDFSEFVKEVRAAYKEAGSPGGADKWYKEEYKSHQNWPGAPYKIYRDKGWEGFPELVRKDSNS